MSSSTVLLRTNRGAYGRQQALLQKEVDPCPDFSRLYYEIQSFLSLTQHTSRTHTGACHASRGHVSIAPLLLHDSFAPLFLPIVPPQQRILKAR